MTEENNQSGTAEELDLRTATARLADLQRKCRSAGSRNQDALEMEDRIGSVLQRLAVDEDPDAEPIPFAMLARELYAVERFFESNGFLSIAKEVAHVERILESFASPDEPEPTILQQERIETSDDGDPPQDAAENDLENDARPSRWAVPRPLAVVMVLFMAAVIACIYIVVQHQKAKNEMAAGPVSMAALVPTPTPRPPTPVPTRIQRTDGPQPGAILAEAVGKARLALGENDIESALDHLSQAALVDSDHATVLGAARQIVDMLVQRADTAVDRGLWEVADLTLSRADRIATRFGLDHYAIEQAARRYEKLDRFIYIRPEKVEAIRAEAGKRTMVYLKDGSKRESVIKGVQNGQLLLDEDTIVRGGTMYYTEKIALNEIDFLKVWDD